MDLDHLPIALCIVNVSSRRIEALNRKRKADQTAVAPTLQGMQAEWITLVKKNLEIEAQSLKLEAECASLQELKEKRRRGDA